MHHMPHDVCVHGFYCEVCGNEVSIRVLDDGHVLINSEFVWKWVTRILLDERANL